MQTDRQNPFQIRNEIKPGDIGYIIYLHGVLYADEYGFDYTFEPYVAKPLAEFVLSATERERLWIAEADGKVVGSVGIVRTSEYTAQLRWLILHPDVRGLGLGKQLVREAVNFSEASGYNSLFLWTISNLEAAIHLYKSAGFVKTEEKSHRLWGVNLTEERYELKHEPRKQNHESAKGAKGTKYD